MVGVIILRPVWLCCKTRKGYIFMRFSGLISVLQPFRNIIIKSLITPTRITGEYRQNIVIQGKKYYG
ncbi:hypothetical protein BHC42_05125 [Snodgrassella alvi]|nr:hypothetical protein BHC50_01095 [Snodgrassella alvi]PIT36134.1 hypothetical protein BHC42_05125 [Snodgrassella alvi]